VAFAVPRIVTSRSDADGDPRLASIEVREYRKRRAFLHDTRDGLKLFDEVALLMTNSMMFSVLPRIEFLERELAAVMVAD
jgi:hypothetical protein